MAGRWVRYALHPTAASLRPALAEALFSAGAQGVHEDGEWLVTHFPAAASLAGLDAAVRACDPLVTVSVDEAPAEDWAVAWRAGMLAHMLGRLTVVPPWLSEGRDPAATVVIEPAMAFGTGEHPTTRGVIRLLQLVIRQGDTVADLGAGSGILAIACAKLGASRVAAIELDPDAISNLEENISRNEVAPLVTVLEGDATVLLPLVAPVRVIVANIVSSVLLALLPAVARSLSRDGVAIFSGILADEREHMVSQLELHGWRILHEDFEAEWWSTCLTR